jgi:amino-acid N-acetyltransferase
MRIIKATEQSRNEIINLLKSNNLPAGDLPEKLDEFYTAMDGQRIVGLIGMERYSHYGLLRSMVVHPDYRNKQIAKKLVQLLEQKAASSGIITMYLLTETAEKYFSRNNYQLITRKEVPEPLFRSSEFSHVCPVSATVMKKELQSQFTTVVQ